MLTPTYPAAPTDSIVTMPNIISLLQQLTGLRTNISFPRLRNRSKVKNDEKVSIKLVPQTLELELQEFEAFFG
ncbi:MAG TPA: hypothetical protein DEF42_00090 [Desulfosporosinus sp.]|nr:hypothetical protein [Desulfosporosinus sp.]